MAPKKEIVLDGERMRLIMDLIDQKANPQRTKWARILLLSERGLSDAKIASQIRCHVTTVERVRKRFNSEKPIQSITPNYCPANKVSDEVISHLLDLVHTPPPTGKTRWTLRLLVNALRKKLKPMGIDRNISHETVRQILKKHCANKKK